eukprot:1137824-Pelagomonas_calceolata.AAC.2
MLGSNLQALNLLPGQKMNVPAKERSTLAVRPRALRKEPPNGSHRQRASFLHPGHKDSIRGPPPCCCPLRA